MPPKAMPGVYIHPLADVEPGAQIGEGTKIWRFCHVMAGARIGKSCMLAQNCFVAAGAEIGDGVRLQNNVSVYRGVVLEAEVFCGPSVVFTNVSRPRAFLRQHASYATTRVLRGATLGANATILPGRRVGRYALVGAGAVVSRDVPDFAEVVGTPARVVGWVSEVGAALEFDGEGRARCPETGKGYRLSADGGRVMAEAG